MPSIENEFSAVGIKRGGLLVLRPNDAIKMVRRCRERHVRILGIEAFILTDNTTQPHMEQSLNMSDIEIRNCPMNCWDLAETFLGERVEFNLHFEMVLEEYE